MQWQNKSASQWKDKLVSAAVLKSWFLITFCYTLSDLLRRMLLSANVLLWKKALDFHMKRNKDRGDETSILNLEGTRTHADTHKHKHVPYLSPNSLYCEVGFSRFLSLGPFSRHHVICTFLLHVLHGSSSPPPFRPHPPSLLSITSTQCYLHSRL